MRGLHGRQLHAVHPTCTAHTHTHARMHTPRHARVGPEQAAVCISMLCLSLSLTLSPPLSAPRPPTAERLRCLTRLLKPS